MGSSDARYLSRESRENAAPTREYRPAGFLPDRVMTMTRRTPRTMARAAAAAVVVLAMSLVTGAESAASEQAADATVTYSCPFPSGILKVPVKISGTFPARGTIGRPIRPGDVTVTPTLPRAALADLAKLDATSVKASARLSVSVVRRGASARVAWSGLAAPSTTIPESGDLPLPASGAVPPAEVKAIGVVAFLAGPLTLVLTPHKADGGATSPATIPLNCTLAQEVVLATVPVPGPNGSATPSHGSGKTRAAPGSAQQQAAADPCFVNVNLSPIPAEAFLAGFSNVNKLSGASLLGRENGQTTGHSILALTEKVVINVCDGSFDQFSSGTLDDHGKPQLPPAKATFLTFGFTPTTATIELTQSPGTRVEIDSHSFPFVPNEPRRQETTVTSQLSIRVRDVLVNGVPLDVGPHCETVRPLSVTLVGKFPEYAVDIGGPLTGTATIPPFSGCGVGEDLDPIFTASISGPGNFMKLTQGVPCTRPPAQPPLNCNPIDRPDPET
jgi:hypothetical protein